MKCARIEATFSKLLDGRLSPEREQAVRAHLTTCPRCREAWSELEASIQALRASGPAPTSSALCRSIVAAVDAAASEDADQAQRSADAFRRARKKAQADRRRDRRRLAGSHLASVAAGLAAGYVLFFGAGGGAAPASRSEFTDRAVASSSDVTSTDAAVGDRPLVDEPGSGSDPAGQVPKVTTEPDVRFVPVPAFVERIVSVPEVVEVERIVARGPLVHVDLAPLERGLASVARSIGSLGRETRGWADELGARLAAASEVPLEPGRERERERDRVARPSFDPLPVSAPRSRSGSSVALRRAGDELQLETRGPLVDVVSLLVAHLDDESPRVRGLVARRLESIRAELAADPVLGPRLQDVPARDERAAWSVEGWLDRNECATLAPRERWSEWRAVNRELLVAASPRSAGARPGS